MTKQEKLKQYNAENPGYHITGIKKINESSIEQLRNSAPKTLNELYESCSDAKHASYQSILEQYNPQEVIGLQGNSMTYSITLVAENGSILWITRQNNYLVEVV